MRTKKESILTDNWDRCYLCGRKANNVHHIYAGSRRAASEKHGFKVPLCADCHTLGPRAVHRCHETDVWLKRECQLEFERRGGSRYEFVRIIGKNYLR
ncbi:MAG: hypothetical protein SPL86_09570 [Succiniclasticum sp.]|uniref:hypothetical protein n=1 Tax=Succiniclasticum sp. TaxID=2775030 RepID=UPI002A91B45A|nr:hypothetical protein [Succiniclasticum sp.]MDY6291717.1 hypothetical protein [Succiniclasticum sp.]